MGEIAIFRGCTQVDAGIGRNILKSLEFLKGGLYLVAVGSSLSMLTCG
jgi:hypothetical protein